MAQLPGTALPQFSQPLALGRGSLPPAIGQQQAETAITRPHQRRLQQLHPGNTLEGLQQGIGRLRQWRWGWRWRRRWRWRRWW